MRPAFLIFQFTPLREGRRASGETSNGAENFNSRPSARGDGQQGYLGLHQGYFNSRPSARGDDQELQNQITSHTFQFTPLREGRRAGCVHKSRDGNFNSRPSARGDSRSPGERRCTASFQFTPLREGRRRRKRMCMSSTEFQFTPLREGRL